jgi:lysophospholipase L1-like esterase
MLRDVIIIITITLGLLLVTELILRILFPEKITTRSKSIAYTFNEDYLISLKPNINKSYVCPEQDGGDTIKWRTNNDCFRGNQLRNNPRFRIMVYGDSNIQARFTKIENTFTYKLGEYLEADGINNTEVINAGIVGFGPDQSLIRFEQELDIYNPDLVIFHIFADNDFGDIVRNRLFELDADGNLIKTDYENTVDQALLPADISTLTLNLLIVRALLKLGRMIRGIDKKEALYNSLQSLTEREYLIYKMSQPREFSHFADHYDIDISLDPEAESSKIKIRLLESILNRSNTFAATKGIKFLVIIQPSIIDLTEHNFVLNYRFLQKKSSNYRRNNLTEEVKNICVRNNIKFVNLFDVFIKNDPKTLFLLDLDNDHWNDRGQEVAAKEIASFINMQKILE